MNKISKEKRDQLIALAGGTLVVLGLVYWLVIGAMAKSTGGVRAAADGVQESVDKAAKLKADSPKIQAELDDSRAALEALEKDMATGDLYSWVIMTLNKFKQDNAHAVDIQNISREERVPIGFFGEYPYDAVKYQVKGAAYYHDFGKFLANLENAFPFARVQNMDLSPEGGVLTGPEAEKLAFRFELVVPLKPKETSK
ncbi:MAG TPA: hypothetical protein VGH19_16960 [Verrucomicrobiae bacterium]